jgi:hypothetical protein
VAGALIGTIVLVAFLAPPVLVLAVIVWLVVSHRRGSSSQPKPDEDPEFTARFREMEEGILTTRTLDRQNQKPSGKRPRRRRTDRPAAPHR